MTAIAPATDNLSFSITEEIHVRAPIAAQSCLTGAPEDHFGSAPARFRAINAAT